MPNRKKTINSLGIYDFFTILPVTENYDLFMVFYDCRTVAEIIYDLFMVGFTIAELWPK